MQLLYHSLIIILFIAYTFSCIIDNNPCRVNSECCTDNCQFISIQKGGLCFSAIDKCIKQGIICNPKSNKCCQNLTCIPIYDNNINGVCCIKTEDNNYNCDNFINHNSTALPVSTEMSTVTKIILSIICLIIAFPILIIILYTPYSH
jgi:hypothetical protein